MSQLTKMHPKCFKWTQWKNKNTHRNKLICSHIPQKRNSNSGTNDKPHQLQKLQENIGIQRSNQYG